LGKHGIRRALVLLTFQRSAKCRETTESRASPLVGLDAVCFFGTITSVRWLWCRVMGTCGISSSRIRRLPMRWLACVLAGAFALTASQACAQWGIWQEPRPDLSAAANFGGGWTTDPLRGTPTPKLSNPYWTTDPLRGTPWPTPLNPYWTTDPLRGTPWPTPLNPYWTTDPLRGTPRPTLTNPYWTTDPLRGTPTPKLFAW